MAIDQRSLPGNVWSPTDTAYRAWGAGISAQLVAIGLVQTADTGQVNWTTVVTPGTSFTYANYEIWRFNDSLQATKPVFIKMEYAIGGGTQTDGPVFRFTVGTGTDGAGNLTGKVSTPRVLQVATSKAAGTLMVSYCSGNSSRLTLWTNHDSITFPNATQFPMGLCIERTKDAVGVETGDGICIYSWHAGSQYAQVVPYGALVPAQGNNPALDLNAGAWGKVSADVVLSPTIFNVGKPLYTLWCPYRVAEITADRTPFAMTHLGASHTFLPLGAAAVLSGHTASAGANFSLAIPWE